MNTVHGKIWRGKIGKLGESSAIRQDFPRQIFTDTPKMYLAYTLTVAYLPKFSSPIAFTSMVRQNFPSPNISHVR